MTPGGGILVYPVVHRGKRYTHNERCFIKALHFYFAFTVIKSSLQEPEKISVTV
jgi:hypothetical protein